MRRFFRSVSPTMHSADPVLYQLLQTPPCHAALKTRQKAALVHCPNLSQVCSDGPRHESAASGSSTDERGREHG